mmetsp:Transcript_24405/g.27061  ORF Transcript_24405/g.27061 Transcript_24405/m.27061 type:complete len:106 (-) Transcript_24405:78-395(-)
MSFNIEQIEHLSTEDFTILKIMEEAAEIEQEIKLKQKSFKNRIELLSALFRKKNSKGVGVGEAIENQDLKKAIESYLLKIEGEHKIMLGYEGRSPSAENAEEMKE